MKKEKKNRPFINEVGTPYISTRLSISQRHKNKPEKSIICSEESHSPVNISIAHNFRAQIPFYVYDIINYVHDFYK